MEKEIDFSKYKVQIPKGPKQNNKHYKRMLRRLRKELPHLNG